jgi:uncharacterized ion transporter superfamily protein YfcC
MVIFSSAGPLRDGRGRSGFYAIILPVIVGLGYDRMVGVESSWSARGGDAGLDVEPVRDRRGLRCRGCRPGDGIGLRLIMYVVMTVVALLACVLRYARINQERSSQVPGAPSRGHDGPWPAQRGGRAAGTDDRPT